MDTAGFGHAAYSHLSCNCLQVTPLLKHSTAFGRTNIDIYLPKQGCFILILILRVANIIPYASIALGNLVRK
jgi:hypothetical protein